jgi:uncharacterized protein (TIGR02118 family)
VIKALRAFRRVPGLDDREFQRRWDEHAERVLAVPGVRGYVQSPRTGRPEQSTAPFDGYSSIWFTDEAAVRRAVRSPEWSAVLAQDVADPASICEALTEEIVQRDVPAGVGAVKLAFFFHRRVGLSHASFRSHWLDVHGPLVMEYIEELRRFVQNPVVDAAYVDGAAPDFDGIAEAYLDDLSTLERTEVSPEHDLVRSDEPNFIDVNRVMHLVATERVVLEPTT